MFAEAQIRSSSILVFNWEIVIKPRITFHLRVGYGFRSLERPVEDQESPWMRPHQGLPYPLDASLSRHPPYLTSYLHQ